MGRVIHADGPTTHSFGLRTACTTEVSQAGQSSCSAVEALLQPRQKSHDRKVSQGPNKRMRATHAGGILGQLECLRKSQGRPLGRAGGALARMQEKKCRQGASLCYP